MARKTYRYKWEGLCLNCIHPYIKLYPAALPADQNILIPAVIKNMVNQPTIDIEIEDSEKTKLDKAMEFLYWTFVQEVI